jgi:hypothetical protein
MHNDALDPVNQFERALTAVLQRLRRLAPAAIEDGVGGGYAGGRRCIFASMIPTRTRIAVRVWLRARERISRRAFAFPI